MPDISGLLGCLVRGTPLNAITGFSELLRMAGVMTPDQTADYADHIANAGAGAC